MNCAIPCARWPRRVIGPIASERKRLSCQITRAKNSSGRFEAFAADSIIRHIASRALLSRAPSAGLSTALARGSKLDRVDSPASSAKAFATEDKSDTAHHRARRDRPPGRADFNPGTRMADNTLVKRSRLAGGSAVSPQQHAILHCNCPENRTIGTAVNLR